MAQIRWPAEFRSLASAIATSVALATGIIVLLVSLLPVSSEGDVSTSSNETTVEETTTTAGPTTTGSTSTTQGPTTTVPPTTTTTVPPQPPFICHPTGAGAPDDTADAMATAGVDEGKAGEDVGCGEEPAHEIGEAWVQPHVSGAVVIGHGDVAFVLDSTEAQPFRDFADFADTQVALAIEQAGVPVQDAVELEDGGRYIVTRGGSVPLSEYLVVVTPPGSTDSTTVSGPILVDWLDRGGPCSDGLGWPTTAQADGLQSFERGKLQLYSGGAVGETTELQNGERPRPIDLDNVNWDELLANLDCDGA